MTAHNIQRLRTSNPDWNWKGIGRNQRLDFLLAMRLNIDAERLPQLPARSLW